MLDPVSSSSIAAVLFLLLALVVAIAKPTRTTTTTTTTSSSSHVPTLDGTSLYYNHTPWPRYEARFNHRLAQLHGPIVLITHPPTRPPLLRLLHVLNNLLYPTPSSSPRHRSTTTLLINSLSTSTSSTSIRALLDAASSREPSLAAGTHLSRGNRIVLQPHGTTWQRHRRALASLLTKTQIRKRWAGVVRHEAMILIERLAAAADTDDTYDEVSRFTASSVLQIAYGRRVRDDDDDDDALLSNLAAVSAGVQDAFAPGRYWVETAPLLDSLPGWWWKRRLAAAHAFEWGVFAGLFRDAADASADASAQKQQQQQQQQKDVVVSAQDCAVAQLLKMKHEEGGAALRFDEMVYLAAGLFEAGTETTAMTIRSFWLAAACYPAQIALAQAELEDSFGSSSSSNSVIPTLEQLEKLPVLSALVKETLRLTPTGTTGVGHTLPPPPLVGATTTTTKTQSFDGELAQVVVPGETHVLVNIYGVHHDAQLFRDPYRFDLQRWLDNDGGGCTTSKYAGAPYAFGFGRRICPGAALASATVTMAVAMLVLCFDFELTERAGAVCAEMEAAAKREESAFVTRFGVVLNGQKEEEGVKKEENQRERMGRVLLDAHVVGQLSKEMVSECVRLVPRRGMSGIEAVKRELARARENIHNGEKTDSL